VNGGYLDGAECERALLSGREVRDLQVEMKAVPAVLAGCDGCGNKRKTRAYRARKRALQP